MSFCLTILGSSSALPTSKRFPTAHVLSVHERFFLIDCGEGTQIQIRKFRIRISKIDHIFISHLHGDHYFGLLGLISTMNLLGRQHNLHIYSDPNLETILNCQLDQTYRAELTFKIIFHHLRFDEPSQIYDDEKLTVQSIPLIHRVPTCGFIFREKIRPRNLRKDMLDLYNIPIKNRTAIKNGDDYITEDGDVIKNSLLTFPSFHPRSYAFISDTLYNEKIIPQIKNIDLLYHEATFSHGSEKRAKTTFHSTSVQAATIAKKADVKKLIIGHFSARYKTVDKLVDEASSVFENTFAAIDGDTHEIKEYRLE